jgi:hypothetical protein
MGSQLRETLAAVVVAAALAAYFRFQTHPWQPSDYLLVITAFGVFVKLVQFSAAGGDTKAAEQRARAAQLIAAHEAGPGDEHSGGAGPPGSPTATKRMPESRQESSANEMHAKHVERLSPQALAAALKRKYTKAEKEQLGAMEMVPLNALQAEAVAVVRAHLRVPLERACGGGAESYSYPEVTGDCRLLRFMRGHKFELAKVCEMAQAMLEWRRRDGEPEPAGAARAGQGQPQRAGAFLRPNAVRQAVCRLQMTPDMFPFAAKVGGLSKGLPPVPRLARAACCTATPDGC